MGESPPKRRRVEGIDLNALSSSHFGSAFVRDNHNFSYALPKNTLLEGYFRNIKKSLIGKLRAYPCFVACVAWLSDWEILSAMRGKSLGIAIQKEDFLRRDSVRTSDRIAAQRVTRTRKLFDETVHHTYACSDSHHPDTRLGESMNTLKVLGGVRCMGTVGGGKETKESRPNMHNKFIVFGRMEDAVFTVISAAGETTEPFRMFVPEAVWTGSFNLSLNSSKSAENTLFVESREVARQFHREWAHIYALSESLDWTSPVPQPDLLLAYK